MIETIVSGLILAGVSALAYLSYSHPRQFKLIAPWLAGVAILLSVGTWIWAFAILSAKGAVSGVPDGGNDIPYQTALDALMPPIWLLTIGLPAALLYILILNFWVTTLKDDHKNQKGS